MADDRKLFRFQDLEVWQLAADLAIHLGEVADHLEELRRYRYAEQLRAAAISISNNIAEGSGSNSKVDFRKFLNYAHRSAFECANMLLVFQRQRLTNPEKDQPILIELNRVCRMITGLGRSL
jgi:four helix bundle protein